jgi:hypothetical protein
LHDQHDGHDAMINSLLVRFLHDQHDGHDDAMIDSTASVSSLPQDTNFARLIALCLVVHGNMSITLFPSTVRMFFVGLPVHMFLDG